MIWLSLFMKEIADSVDAYKEYYRKKEYEYLKGNRWTNEQIEVMKKESKNDDKARRVVTGKTAEVEITVERPENMSFEEYNKQLETERDAFKITAEKYMGKYLTLCAKKKEMEDKHLYVLDAFREAFMQIEWLVRKLPWWKKLRYHSMLRDMQNDLDRKLAHAEGLDRE